MNKDSVMPLICPNCGAPLRDSECEYCGSVFWTLESKHPPVKVEFEGERTVRVYDSESKQWVWVPDKTSAEQPKVGVISSDEQKARERELVREALLNAMERLGGKNPLPQAKPITQKRWT